MSDIIKLQEFSLDFVNSQNPAVLDRGIRETIIGVQISGLAVGYALVRIRNEKLFKRLGFENFTQYMDDLNDKSSVSRSTLYNWLKAGTIFTEYQADLESIGFSSEDGLTKLLFLERALAKGNKDEIMNKLKILNYQEFTDLAKTIKQPPPEGFPFWELTGNIFMQEGQRAVIINGDLGEYSQKILLGMNTAAFKAIERKGSLLAVQLDSMEEVRIMRRIVRRARRRMRERMRKKVR